MKTNQNRTLVNLVDVGLASLVGLALVALSGCQTGPALPAVGPGIVAAAHGVGSGRLEEGRRLVAYRCTDCHRARPPGQYSVEEWEDVLDHMAPRAKLTAAEKAAVFDYLSAASRVARASAAAR